MMDDDIIRAQAVCDAIHHLYGNRLSVKPVPKCYDSAVLVIRSEEVEQGNQLWKRIRQCFLAGEHMRRVSPLADPSV